MKIADCKVGDRVKINMRAEGYETPNKYIWATLLKAIKHNCVVGWRDGEEASNPAMSVDDVGFTQGAYVRSDTNVFELIELCPQCKGYHQ